VDDQFQRVDEVVGDHDNQQALGDDEPRREREPERARHDDADAALCAVSDAEGERGDDGGQPRRDAEAGRDGADGGRPEDELL